MEPTVTTTRKCARRTLHNLHILNKLVSPRVIAAIISTIFNRWCTRRRYQNGQGNCVLKCDPRADDSIEHYCNCPTVKKVGRKVLNLNPANQINILTFNLCNQYIRTQEDLTNTGLLIYAVYRATNHYRQHPGENEEHIFRGMKH